MVKLTMIYSCLSSLRAGTKISASASSIYDMTHMIRLMQRSSCAVRVSSFRLFLIFEHVRMP